LDKSTQHIKIKNNLNYDIGDLVKFKSNAVDLYLYERKKMWIIKEYINKGPEECSVYDYLLTDGLEEVNAIEYELERVKQ
tara:strand:- start:1805 stop:2044 length:240 start_codon:yes stop_codon:yes gene_type:complete